MKNPLSVPPASFPSRYFLPTVALATSLWIGGPLPARAEPPVKEVESQTAATAGKAVLVVSENGGKVTLEAEGRDVNVDGNKNEVILRGKCHALTVSGSGNTVHADAVATISTPGDKNAVTYKATVDGEKPQVTDVGSGNSVAKTAE